MEQLAPLTNRKKKSAARLTRNSKIIKTIIAAIQEKKGANIVSLDLRKINEAVADFFIICEANSQPQIRAIADNVEEHVKQKCSENPYHHEGFQQSTMGTDRLCECSSACDASGKQKILSTGRNVE